jgi:hypothetical protein
MFGNVPIQILEASETITCPLCQEEHRNPLMERYTLAQRTEKIIKWKMEGEMIQVVFPELSIDEREIIKTGICTPCWNTMFKEPPIGQQNENEGEEE